MKKLTLKFIFEFMINLIIIIRKVSTKQGIDCFYEECYCITEITDNSINNQISIACLSQRINSNFSTKTSLSPKFYSIRSFQIYNYNLNYLPAQLFYDMNIDYLVIDLNYVKYLKSDTFNGIYSLNNLVLYHLNGFEQNFIAENLKGLRFLSIELSSLTNFKLELLRKDLLSLNELNYLALSHNKLTSFNGNFLKDLKKLETLKLNNNAIEIVSFPIIDSLKYLILSSNKLKFITSLTFGNLKNLVLLDLFENGIKTVEDTSFINTENLMYLYLGNNQLEEMPDIKNLKNLKLLDIKNQQGKTINIYNDSFELSFDSSYTNPILSVYLDDYQLNDINYYWFMGKRSIILHTTSFNLTIKDLEYLFINYLEKVDELSLNYLNKNYILYRLFSHQTISTFDLNYFATNYELRYDFKMKTSVFNVTKFSDEQNNYLICNYTFFHGFLVNQSQFFCFKQQKAETYENLESKLLIINQTEEYETIQKEYQITTGHWESKQISNAIRLLNKNSYIFVIFNNIVFFFLFKLII